MGKHLATFRAGWQSENLARYILSTFAFIAQPSTIADDIGSDFFCTIFEAVSYNNNEYLSPKESFAIQIKSNSRSFSISNKKEYLKNLGIPYFVGVVNRDKRELDVFSGAYLIPFFVDNPNAQIIKIKLNINCDDEIYNHSDTSGEFTINFPKILTIGPDQGSSDLSSNVKKLSRICQMISRNIARRNNNEFIFIDSKGKSLLVNNKILIQKSLSSRLANIFSELSNILAKNLIAENIKEYETIRDTIMRNLKL